MVKQMELSFICHICNIVQENDLSMAVVVVQVIEWSLPTPEIHSSNSVIGKFYFLSNCIEKMNKEKICQEWPNLKK